MFKLLLATGLDKRLFSFIIIFEWVVTPETIDKAEKNDLETKINNIRAAIVGGAIKLELEAASLITRLQKRK